MKIIEIMRLENLIISTKIGNFRLKFCFKEFKT